MRPTELEAIRARSTSGGGPAKAGTLVDDAASRCGVGRLGGREEKWATRRGRVTRPPTVSDVPWGGGGGLRQTRKTRNAGCGAGVAVIRTVALNGAPEKRSQSGQVSPHIRQLRRSLGVPILRGLPHSSGLDGEL